MAALFDPFWYAEGHRSGIVEGEVKLIGENIQKRRKVTGLSQERLAQAVGGSRARRSSAGEPGAAVPSVKNLLKQGKTLGPPVSELHGEENRESA